MSHSMGFGPPALGLGLTLVLASIVSMLADSSRPLNVVALLVGCGISLGSYVDMNRRRG